MVADRAVYVTNARNTEVLCTGHGDDAVEIQGALADLADNIGCAIRFDRDAMEIVIEDLDGEGGDVEVISRTPVQAKKDRHTRR